VAIDRTALIGVGGHRLSSRSSTLHAARCTAFQAIGSYARPAHDGVRLPGHVERRTPVAVAVFRELEIPSGPVHALSDLADAAPVIEPAPFSCWWVSATLMG